MEEHKKAFSVFKPATFVFFEILQTDFLRNVLIFSIKSVLKALSIKITMKYMMPLLL